MNEAPKSMTIQGYYKGFSVLITKRDDKEVVQPLLEDAIKIVDWMTAHGFLPSWNKETNRELTKDTTPSSKTNPSASSDVTGVLQDPTWIGQPKEYTRVPVPEGVVVPSFCRIHDKEMEQKKGPFGVFWSHYVGRTPEGDYQYCNGVKISTAKKK